MSFEFSKYCDSTVIDQLKTQNPNLLTRSSKLIFKEIIKDILMKNICKTIVMCFSFITFLGNNAQAQDPHFSQFYNAPMQLNPALTGLLAGDTRAVMNYRSQWSSVATPFRTMAGSVDVKLLEELTKKDVFGVGLFVINDVAGEVDLRNVQVGLSFAYNKDMNGKRNHFIGIGAQYLISQQSFNYTKLRFESQFDGEIIDPSAASGEVLPNNNFQYFDFNAGISWSYRPNKQRAFYAGGSLSHLNSPKVSFFEDIQERLKMKYTFYAGAEFKVTPNISFIPRSVVLMQGPAKEINFGATMKFAVGNSNSHEDQTSISFGTMHRWKDAQVIIMRYDYNDVGISFSYDVNTSNLNIPSKGRGAVELAVIFNSDVFAGKRNTKVVCPKF